MVDHWMQTPSGKTRARALGIPFLGRCGPFNAVTDVPGVEVGYAAVIAGDSVRTGVTAIHPRGRSNPKDPVVAGIHAQNGNGEMTGSHWIHESGTTAGPIAITNTHAVGIAHAGIIAWVLERHPEMGAGWLLPVAAETWDGYLNDINGAHVTAEMVKEALDSARSGPIEEGSVGGGTGMVCYEFKGGSGTSSRVVDYHGDEFVVGAFVQANFGRRTELTIAGQPVGRLLAEDERPRRDSPLPPGAGSIIAVVATNAPLLPGQCQALARRATLGIGRTGTQGSHFSGDLFLAFSTANAKAFDTVGGEEVAGEAYRSLTFVPWPEMDPFFDAVVQSVEEAVLNALIANQDMVGLAGHRVTALPHQAVRNLFDPQW